MPSFCLFLQINRKTEIDKLKEDPLLKDVSIQENTPLFLSSNFEVKEDLKRSRMEMILTSCSLLINGRDLFSSKPTELSVLNGIRVLSIW